MSVISVCGCDVTVAPGALDDLGGIVERSAPAHRYAIISDAHVAGLHASRARSALGGERSELYVVPAGEGEKTRDRWAALTDAMLADGLGRDTTVIALGGGVIGDLAGFVAATYLRGVPIVQVPTTLLAMVDAAVGGKTGVDTGAGKNLVGAFHRPAAVVVDPSVLTTLPHRHVAAGFAEVLKHGVIADEPYFEHVTGALPALIAGPGAAAMVPIVERSIAIKGEVVTRDERETGERATLNFGHTIGHAIETASGYGILHGEAIAIGMVIESACGERIGVTAAGTAARLAAALARAGLPVRRPGTLSPLQILGGTRADKKRARSVARYALPAGVGLFVPHDGQWTVPVPDEVVLDALA